MKASTAAANAIPEKLAIAAPYILREKWIEPGNRCC